MSHELYRRYRPKTLDRVLGQGHAVSVIESKLKSRKYPHATLLSGPSGCGKTTLARIVSTELKCHPHDIQELDIAQFSGVETVRTIRRQMHAAGLGENGLRLWILDECHQLSSEGQNGLLKALEDCPRHVYFFLCTTDPQKLKPTVRNRCTHFALKDVDPPTLTILINRVLKREKRELKRDLVKLLVEHADGSPRQALVVLDQVLAIDDPKKQREAICSVKVETAAIEIARALLKTNVKWADIAKILKEVKEDPESIRRMVLSYMTNVALGGNNSRAVAIIEAFRDNYFDSGRAGLVASCYEMIGRKG